MDEQDRGRWTKLVADFESSDLTQREFASERGVSFSNLRNWIYRLRKESRPLVAEAGEGVWSSPRASAAPEGSRLLPVRVVASAREGADGGGAAAAATSCSSWRCRRAPASASRPAPISQYLRALAAAL